LSSFFSNSSIFYAMKANFHGAILKEVKEAGAGIDIVSIGEWRAARDAGIFPKNICFSGVGKQEFEWKEAIENELGFLNVEHLQELEDILNFIFLNNSQKIKTPLLSLRMNPCIPVNTHSHLKTGDLDSKFGILFEHFSAWLITKKMQYSPEWFLPLQGLHVHVGSQVTQKEIADITVRKILDCAHFMQEQGLNVTNINLGGGLGVGYDGVPLNASDITEHVTLFCTSLKNTATEYSSLLKMWGENFSKLHVCFEPGRSIIASSTVFLTRVLYDKKNSDKYLFCYVDGAMNDFPRPSIYGARHHAELVDFANEENAKEEPSLLHWQIVGPVCESGDFLSKDSLLPQVHKGDIIAFFEAGAYCRSMASNYNLRPFPNELFIKDGKLV